MKSNKLEVFISVFIIVNIALLSSEASKINDLVNIFQLNQTSIAKKKLIQLALIHETNLLNESITPSNVTLVSLFVF